LAGGGARGAYELGALSVLLPRLKRDVKLILGTSVGAFNAILPGRELGEERSADRRRR
jgi:NTE family protein